jgi:TolB-like protein
VQDAYRQVKRRLDLAVADLGPTQLKNIAEPIRVYSLDVGQSARAKPTLAPASEKSAPPRLSMVVLPFAILGGDPEQEHFVDGVTESLTTGLSRIRHAIVIGRNTAFTYKGKAVDLKQLGRELNVRYVLEGSLQRGGNRMRVNVQLIDAETAIISGPSGSIHSSAAFLALPKRVGRRAPPCGLISLSLQP